MTIERTIEPMTTFVSEHDVMSWLRRTDRRALAWLEPRLDALDVTMSEFRIVRVLLTTDHGLKQRALAERVGVEPPSLSVALKKLELKGMVERVADPGDARVKRVQVREESEVIERVRELVDELEFVALEGFSPDDAEQLRTLLRRVHENL